MAFNRMTGRSVNLKCNVNVNVQDVCKKCARCVQVVRKMCDAYVMFDIIEPHGFRKYSTCWVLEKSEEP